MILPETVTLNYFNKVLITLLDISPDGESCEIKTLIDQCKLVALGGIRIDYDEVITQCIECGLLSRKENMLSISILGSKYIASNPEKYIEITESQKQILSDRLVFRGVGHKNALELFKHFHIDTSSNRYELDLNEYEPNESISISIHFFQYLGIIYKNESILVVNEKYSQSVYEITADAKTISEQKLEQLMMENRKLGAKAELAVMEFEKQRLRNMGREIQAELVKRISTINAAAGYDIESFDGNTDDVFPNRFIEVKATVGDDIRFYWSSNEKKVASKINDKYWIYVLTAFQENETKYCVPFTIQNPDHKIPRVDYLSMEVNKYCISEIKDVRSEEITLNDLTWNNLI